MKMSVRIIIFKVLCPLIFSASSGVSLYIHLFVSVGPSFHLAAFPQISDYLLLSIYVFESETRLVIW